MTGCPGFSLKEIHESKDLKLCSLHPRGAVLFSQGQPLANFESAQFFRWYAYGLIATLSTPSKRSPERL